MLNKNIQTIIEVFNQEIEGIHLENQLVLLLIEAVIIFVAWIVLKRKWDIPWYKYLLGFLFLVYTGILLSLTIFRRPEGSREGIVHLFINLGFGIKTGNPSIRVSALSVLNILLFVPLGILVFLKNVKDSWGKSVIIATLTGAALSIFIECTQLITGRGMFEVTDMFTNTGGSLIGALLAALSLFLLRKAASKQQKK